MNTQRNTTQDADSGYLPKAEESSNDSDLYSLAPILRSQVRGDAKLSNGAKVLYTHLSDRQFYKKISPAPGVVDMTKPRLAQELVCCVSTIRRQAKELEDENWVSTSTFYYCGFEMTRWFLRGICDDQLSLFDGHDPRVARPDRKQRRLPQRGQHGKFSGPAPAGPPAGPNGQNCAFGANGENKGFLTVEAEMHAVNGQECTPSTVRNARRPRSGMHADGVHSSPLVPPPMDKNDRGPLSKLTVDGVKDCTRTACKSDRGRRAGMTGTRKTEAGSQESGSHSEKTEDGVCEPSSPKPAHTQLPSFEPLDLKMAPRLRGAWGEKAIEFCKGKIYALEQSRSPVANGQEIIAAYRQRIKAVKKFMVGEL